MQQFQSKEFSTIDVLAVLSFWIGLLNLDENLSQGKAAELLKAAVSDIHEHLAIQDEKLGRILEVLENEKNTSNNT